MPSHTLNLNRRFKWVSSIAFQAFRVDGHAQQHFFQIPCDISYRLKLPRVDNVHYRRYPSLILSLAAL